MTRHIPEERYSLLAPESDVVVGIDEFRLKLTDEERAAVRKLAGELIQSPPSLIDDPGWQAAARRLSCGLPVRVLEVLRQLRQDSGVTGNFSFAGLPIDENLLPDTPSSKDSAERVPRIPAAVAMLLGQQLGEVIAYRDEKQGGLVQNIVPVRDLAGSQSNAGSVPLYLHSENAFHPCRPDLVGLLCLRPDRDGIAGTLVASIRQALPLLSEADLPVLSSPRFITSAPPSFGVGNSTAPHPVLGGNPRDPNIRVDFHATRALDTESQQALDRLEAALTRVSSSLVLRSGEMIFIDNRLVVHGRGKFAPKYDGRDRWLHRVYVHLDSRRSTFYRFDQRPVLY
jgi:L-asparagine oxygenase